MGVCGFEAVTIKCRACEFTIQRQYGALREGEVVQKASGTGRPDQSEFLQGGETNSSAWRRSLNEWLISGDTNFHEFERGASFEEGCQILNGNCCHQRVGKPYKGGEAKITKVHVDTM